MSKKILLVVPVYASYHCFLRELAEALVRRGWGVSVVCDLSVAMGQQRDPERERGIAFFDMRFPRGLQPLSYLRASARLRRVIEELQPEIVHAHFSAAILVAALAVRRRDRFAAIGTFQGLQFSLADGWKKTVYLRAEAFASRRLKGVWVLTRDDLEALGKAGVPGAHMQKAYGFGCRIDEFDPGRFSGDFKREFRVKWGIGEADPVFVFIGRNVAFKGFPLVIRGFFRLLESRANARLLIVGDRDPLHPTGLTAEEEARMLACPEIIRCGWQRNVAPFLAIADALVHPSSREGMPVGCMEAVAMGVRLIAADSRGSRELLELAGQRPVAGLTPTAVADAMAGVVEKKKANGSSGSGKDEKVRALLDRFAYVEEQIRVYEELSA